MTVRSPASFTSLRVSDFGKFGYAKLYKQFEKEHPGVTVVESAEGDLGQYNTQLTQKIAAARSPRGPRTRSTSTSSRTSTRS